MGLINETAEHTFNHCGKAQGIWGKVGDLTDRRLFSPDSISSGNWLDYRYSGVPKHMASVTAAVVWFVWKARCDLIFKNRQPNYSWIARMAIAHIQEFSTASTGHLGKNFFLLNKPAPGSYCIFSAALGAVEAVNGGAGFCIVGTGCWSEGPDRCLTSYQHGESEVGKVFVSCLDLLKANGGGVCEHMAIALMDPVSLFHCRLESSRWLMRVAGRAGFLLQYMCSSVFV